MAEAKLAKTQRRRYVLSVVKQRVNKIKNNRVQKGGCKANFGLEKEQMLGPLRYLCLPFIRTLPTRYLPSAPPLRELKQGTGLVNGKSAMAIALYTLGMDWYPALLFSARRRTRLVLDLEHACLIGLPS